MMDEFKSSVPLERVRLLNSGSLRPEAGHVLYWMVSARRAGWNFALDRAVELARGLDRPLIVLEGLRAGYARANDRLHRFVIDGMADNEQAFAGSGALYYPYVEPADGQGKGLLEALAAEACIVVTDDYPAFFLPRMITAAASRIAVRVEAVDSNGLLPLRATSAVFTRAFDFRRYLQSELRPHLERGPRRDPLETPIRPARALPETLTARWPRADAELLAGREGSLAQLAIDHGVAPVPYRGGSTAGGQRLREFLAERLPRYGIERNDPDGEATSGLSPYLHFGHVSAHEVWAAVAASEGWSPQRISSSTSGKRSGWWGLSPAAETFVDELVTWRELGFNFCAHRDDYDCFESLPAWARATLDDHADDERPYVYSLEQFERARTHDELWNAAQQELRAEGRIHNYLRMLWGKQILHWSESPREALRIMIELNDKYAVDGRDPNSYSGIFWVLGRYDRAWEPERDVFGSLRYMATSSARRKLKLDRYLQRWVGGQVSLPF